MCIKGEHWDALQMCFPFKDSLGSTCCPCECARKIGCEAGRQLLQSHFAPTPSEAVKRLAIKSSQPLPFAKRPEKISLRRFICVRFCCNEKHSPAQTKNKQGARTHRRVERAACGDQHKGGWKSMCPSSCRQKVAAAEREHADAKLKFSVRNAALLIKCQREHVGGWRPRWIEEIVPPPPLSTAFLYSHHSSQRRGCGNQ